MTIWPFGCTTIALTTPLIAGAKVPIGAPEGASSARLDTAVPPTLLKRPPTTMSPLVRTAAALTVPFGFGAKVVSSVPSALSRARLLYGTPPMLLNDPPTIVWPELWVSSAFTGPSVLAVNFALTVLSAFSWTRYFSCNPPTWVKAPPTNIAPPVSTAVKVPPRKIEPSLRIAIALTPELEPGIKGRVQRAVGVDPRDEVAGGRDVSVDVEGGEIPADHDLAVGLDPNRVDRRIGVGREAGVDRAVGIEPGDVIGRVEGAAGGRDAVGRRIGGIRLKFGEVARHVELAVRRHLDVKDRGIGARVKRGVDRAVGIEPGDAVAGQDGAGSGVRDGVEGAAEQDLPAGKEGDHEGRPVQHRGEFASSVPSALNRAIWLRTVSVVETVVSTDVK